MAQEIEQKKPQIRQAGSAETFEGSNTTGNEQLRSSAQTYVGCKHYFDRPSYPDYSGRTPWELVTGAEPLKSTPYSSWLN
jgi:hypothetical protein